MILVSASEKGESLFRGQPPGSVIYSPAFAVAGIWPCRLHFFAAGDGKGEEGFCSIFLSIPEGVLCFFEPRLGALFTEQLFSCVNYRISVFGIMHYLSEKLSGIIRYLCEPMHCLLDHSGAKIGAK